MTVAEIPVGHGRFALVDQEDVDRLARFTWRVNQGYAVRDLNSGDNPRCTACGQVIRGTRFLHHEVLGLPPQPDMVVDHRNGNRLDCCKANLRWVTRQQNQWNLGTRSGAKKSTFKGVSHQRGGRWIAYIGSGTNRRHLGSFDTERQAAEAYNAAARETFGEYARLNQL